MKGPDCPKFENKPKDQYSSVKRKRVRRKHIANGLALHTENVKPEREDVIADTGAGKWMFMKDTGRVKNPQPTATMIRVAKPGTDGLIGNVVEGDLRLS
eukprot:1951412-Rhodomonas_salina.1